MEYKYVFIVENITVFSFILSPIKRKKDIGTQRATEFWGVPSMICRDPVHSLTGRLPGMEGAKARLWRQEREARHFE